MEARTSTIPVLSETGVAKASVSSRRRSRMRSQQSTAEVSVKSSCATALKNRYRNFPRAGRSKFSRVSPSKSKKGSPGLGVGTVVQRLQVPRDKGQQIQFNIKYIPRM